MTSQQQRQQSNLTQVNKFISQMNTHLTQAKSFMDSNNLEESETELLFVDGLLRLAKTRLKTIENSDDTDKVTKINS